MSQWEVAQSWEQSWWGDCLNTINEEQKQLVYAEKMGLIRTPTPKTPYNFDLQGKSVLDIGGGAVSLLLKCVNFKGTVVDPLMKKYPKWVIERYREAGIDTYDSTGEEIVEKFPEGTIFDVCFLYNVLEHVIDPKKVVESILELSKVVRIFEWLETTPNIGHPHSLTEKQLNEYLGGEGKVEKINHDGAVGLAFYGVFAGKNYVTSIS